MSAAGEAATPDVAVVTGDITRLRVDAIVNAANSRLLPGGGVCGAIHAAAGPQLAAECRAIGRCATGDAVATGGYGLPASHVIHAVGPVWSGGGADEDAQLASAYRSAIAVARSLGAQSIAFPAISTGIYGFPPARAADIAVAAVLAELRRDPSRLRVVLCCFTEESANLHRAALSRAIGRTDPPPRGPGLQGP